MTETANDITGIIYFIFVQLYEAQNVDNARTLRI